MKIESFFQSQQGLGKQSQSDADGKLMRQTWLKEMEKARDGMINMQSVNSGLIPSDSVHSRLSNIEETPHEFNPPLMNELFNIPGSSNKLSSSETHMSSMIKAAPLEVNFKTSTLLNNLIANVKNDFNIKAGIGKSVDANLQLSRLNKVLPENPYEVWNKKNIHLANTDEGLALWLRDVEIDQDNEIQICREIQKRLSDLGIHLAKVYLNGRLISTFNPADPII